MTSGYTKPLTHLIQLKRNGIIRICLFFISSLLQSSSLQPSCAEGKNNGEACDKPPQPPICVPPFHTLFYDYRIYNCHVYHNLFHLEFSSLLFSYWKVPGKIEVSLFFTNLWPIKHILHQIHITLTIECKKYINPDITKRKGIVCSSTLCPFKEVWYIFCLVGVIFVYY